MNWLLIIGDGISMIRFREKVDNKLYVFGIFRQIL
tara:strand:- start:19535 stop:19639 length:105 start_codon:yes stop_codon:yes gene_type:complete